MRTNQLLLHIGTRVLLPLIGQKTHVLSEFLKLTLYSCISYPTRASYSGQVDEFRNPMKNELKTRP